MINTDEADLNHVGATRTIAHEYGPAIELALDGAGNVLIDSPDGKSSAATTLLRVNLATGVSSSTGLKDAHYPTVLGSRLISVTGRRDALTTVDSTAYSPRSGTSTTSEVSAAADEYDAQQVDPRLVLTLSVDGLTLVDTQNHRSTLIQATPVVQASVTSGEGRIVFAVQQGATEILLLAKAGS